GAAASVAALACQSTVGGGEGLAVVGELEAVGVAPGVAFAAELDGDGKLVAAGGHGGDGTGTFVELDVRGTDGEAGFMARRAARGCVRGPGPAERSEERRV